MSVLSERIEIPVFLIFITFMLSSNISNNFIIYRTCYVSLGYNESDCALLGTNDNSDRIRELELEVQPNASVLIMVRSILMAVVPAFVCFIIGPWSNKHGRKPVLLITFFSLAVSYLIGMTIMSLKWASPWLLLISVVAMSFGGGFCSLLTAAFCYITDISSEDTRSTKMAILELCMGIGSIVGTLSASYLLDMVGYNGVNGTCAGITFLAFLYTYFFLDESLTITDDKNKLRDFFDFSVIIQTIKITLKSRTDNKRVLLILLISILALNVFVTFGDMTVLFLYVRERFNWSLTKYTWFSATNTAIDVISAIIILGIVFRKLKVKDMTIIAFAFIFMFIASFIFAFANNDWEIFLASVLRRTNISLLPLTRAAISQIIPADELGSVFAFTTSLEMCDELVATPLYTFVYNATLASYPSAYNFLSAIIFGIGIIVTSTVIYVRRLQSTYTKEMSTKF